MERVNFVIFCKTYRNDLKSFRRLVDSLAKHNVENIPVYVSVPESDIDLFRVFEKGVIKLISDESYAKRHFSSSQYWGLSLGYINQEICKLSFWEAEICDNYLCVDSDAYFIRDFSIRDFMADGNIPYSVLVMDKDLNIEKYYQEFGKWRQQMIRKIFEYIQYNDNRFLTCHGMTVLNRFVLEDLYNNLLVAKKMDYRDLIAISPYEYSWYNAWLQYSKIIPIFSVEPFFKTFHMRIEYIFSRLRLIEESDLSQQYVGIVLNSNWKPKGPPISYEPIGIWYKFLYNFFSKL